jgi:queuine tRNA-ribosyltransferase
VKSFKTLRGKRYKLPIFFPDATRAVVRALDSEDVVNTKTPGVLVNTYHLYRELGKRAIAKFNGISSFMNWNGAIISDSGGFQVMSIVKRGRGMGKVIDEGVIFYPSKKRRIVFTPEKSIEIQMLLKTDMIVVLDDFTEPSADYKNAKDTVERTIEWARRSKITFERLTKNLSKKEQPYLIAVVQGGKYQDLRKYCARKLSEIGFDGYGYGGWPIREDGVFDYDSARTIVRNVGKNNIVWGLGIGKPEEIVGCYKLGYNVFDCVLPTRDARHKRLYVYDADSIDKIDVFSSNFYSFYTPDKQKYYTDTSPVSTACDCLLCKRYSKAYLSHLFRIGDISAKRLSTIHNLRFYSILMEKLSRGSGC